MGRHLQRHRIALIACALTVLLAALVAPHALSPGDGEAGAPYAEQAAPARAGAMGSSAVEPDTSPERSDAADAGSPPDGSDTSDASPSPATRRSSPLDMREEARSVLSAYRERGDCVLARAGYLDLVGRVWSCTVQGDGWVDVCVVRSNEEGDGSVVTTVRMGRDEWTPGSLLSDLGGSDGS